MSENNKNQEDKINQYDRLIVDILNNLITRLDELMSNLLNTAPDKLLEISDKADSNEKLERYEKQTHYSELIAEVQILKPTIKSNFNKKIKDYLLPAKKLDPEQEAIDDELSLMDHDIMETMVLIEGISNHALDQYREQLAYLDVRLDYLAVKTTKIFNKNALMPINFCQAFADTLADDFNNADKTLLFSIFEVEVAQKLGPLYDSINEQLIEGNILPKIKLKIQAPSSHQDSAEGARDSASTESSKNDYAGSEEYQHYTSGMPASEVGRVVGDYIGIPLTDKSSESYGEFFPKSTPQHFGHQEIIHALSNLQNLPQFNQPEGERLDGKAIKDAVLAEIAKKSGGAVSKRINTIAEKTIDFIELIFDAIIDDDDISDTIKTLLLRLQIPIIKASMVDQEFFIYDDHPARVLLDTIADAGIGVTEHTDEMFKHLDKVITSILGEYDLTTEIFQNALDQLKSIIEEEETKARTIEEEQQQQLLRNHARATVLKALRATTIGKTLPEGVHPLILKRWPTLMFNHYISNGKENNEWVNLLLTLRHIVESVQPVTSAEHLAKLLADKDGLLERTEQYLNTSSNSKKDVNSIMESYRENIQLRIDDANFTEEEVTDAEEVISQAEPVEEAPIEEEPAPAKQTLASNIMPGMWFQVYMGDDQVVRRCKLSVIIIEDSNLMFVNHKGALVVEKSFDDFNEEIASNKSKVIMGHSAFDHAFKAVIDRLE